MECACKWSEDGRLQEEPRRKNGSSSTRRRQSTNFMSKKLFFCSFARLLPQAEHRIEQHTSRTYTSSSRSSRHGKHHRRDSRSARRRNSDADRTALSSKERCKALAVDAEDSRPDWPCWSKQSIRESAQWPGMGDGWIPGEDGQARSQSDTGFKVNGCYTTVQ